MIRVTPRQADLLVPDWEGMSVPQPEPEARKKASDKSKAADLFAAQCVQYRLPPVEREHQFAKAAMGRKWAFDFCWRQYMLAVEIEGMAVELRCAKCYGKELIIRGRHGSIGGINEDMVKYNTAALLGWTLIRFATKDVKPKHAIEMTIQVLAARGWRRAES